MSRGWRYRLFAGALLLFAALFVAPSSPAAAAGLQIRPLLYKEQLKAGETKKGYVEVSNALHTPTKLRLHIKEFRQINGAGNLEFFTSESLTAAVKLDLTEVDLGPREAARVYFAVDGTKLPPGDIFGSIFAATVAQSDAGIIPSAQVGTLLILENGRPGPREAAITRPQTPLLQTGNSITGAVDVTNVASKDAPSAFFPVMRASFGPVWGESRQFEGPLIFAGITRKVSFSVPSRNRIGVFKITVEGHGAKAEKWVLLVTGFWRPVVVVSGLIALLAGYMLVGRKRTGPTRRPVAAMHPKATPPDIDDTLPIRGSFTLDTPKITSQSSDSQSTARTYRRKPAPAKKHVGVIDDFRPMKKR